MRVRNPENPSDRTAGIKTEQMLEPNNVNYTNTLTSVQKDNLVLEADIINTLKDVEGVGWHFAQNVYSEDSPCIRSIKSGEGSGNIPKIIKIRQATKDGFIECELPGVADLNYPSSETRRGRVQDGGASKSNFDNGEYP